MGHAIHKGIDPDKHLGIPRTIFYGFNKRGITPFHATLFPFTIVIIAISLGIILATYQTTMPQSIEDRMYDYRALFHPRWRFSKSSLVQGLVDIFIKSVRGSLCWESLCHFYTEIPICRLMREKSLWNLYK